MLRFSMIVAAILLSLSAPLASAQPKSLMYPTRTGNWSNDLRRVASLAQSIAEMSGKLAYHFYSVPQEYCYMNVPCFTVAQEIVGPLGNTARALADRAWSSSATLVDSAAIDAELDFIRTQYFNSLAWHQESLRNAFPAGPTSGSSMADLTCGDIMDIYWVLMNQLVNYPRAAGAGGGRGED